MSIAKKHLNLRLRPNQHSQIFNQCTGTYRFLIYVAGLATAEQNTAPQPSNHQSKNIIYIGSAFKDSGIT